MKKTPINLLILYHDAKDCRHQ